MADGSIRIKTRIDNSGAKKDAKEFEKVVDKAAEKAKQSGEKATVDIDVSQAEKEIKRLEKEIKKYEAMIEELEAGKLGKYNAERAALNESTKADLAKAQTPEQKANVLAMHESTLAQIESKYSSVLAKADQYGNIIAQDDAKIQQLKKSIEQVDAAQRQVNTDTQKNDKATAKAESHASRLKQMLGGAKNAASGIAKTMGGAALTGIKKVSTAVKSKLTSGLKKSVSYIKNMGKQADGLRKKFLKAGLALVGIRGLMAGIRQIVSSALQNNEKLQNQLTAIKGVLGQALLPVISVITDALGQVVTFADKLYQMLTGTSLVAKYNASQADKLADSTADAAKSAKDYKNQMAGFDVASKLEDNSSSSSANSSSGDLTIFETQELSTWAQELISKIKSSWQNADFTDVGKMISQKITEQVQGISWESIKDKAFGTGKSFATFLNGLFEYSDEDGNTLSKSLGKSVGEAVNTGINLAYGFVTTFKFDEFGSEIGKGLSTSISTIDWNKLKSTTEKGISGFIISTKDALVNFCKGKGLTTLAEGASSIVQGILGGIEQGLDNITNEELDAIADDVVDAVEKALDDLPTVIVSVLKIAFEVVQITGNFGEKIFQRITEDIFDVFGFDIEWTGDSWQLAGPMALTLPGFTIKRKEGDGKSLKDKIKEALGWDDGQSFWDNLLSIIPDPITMSVAVTATGKETSSFTNLKSRWDSIKNKANTSTINGSISSGFNTLKTKWDSIKNKTNTSTIKGSINSGFTTLKTKWDSIKNKTNTATIKGSVNNTFNTLKTKWDGVKSKTVEITAKFKDAVTSAINSLISRLNTVISKLKSIKVAGIQPFSGLSTIPMLAKGGIVNNPGRGVQAIVGEAGPEAVLPLTDAVLGKIASMISDRIIINQPPIQLTNNNYLDGRLIEKRLTEIQSQRAFMTNKGGAY